MHLKNKLLIRLILSFCALQLFGVDHVVWANNNLINKKVDRTIDLTTQLVKITTKIIVENPNDKPTNEYYVVIENDHAPNLAYIAAYSTVKGHQTALLLNKINQHTYSIKLNNEIKANSQSDLITVEQFYIKLLVPFPEKIKQNGRQLVKYSGNHYYYSLYDTRTQQTHVKLPATGSIESYSKTIKPVTQTDRAIHYGPFENVPKLAEEPLQIHNENNAPFLVVSELDRKIELSPWANVARIEDTIVIYHNGAKLDGPFSRFDYQKEQTSGLSAVNALRTKISRKAKHIFYRDEIGNISSSDVRPLRDDLIVTLKPRFPLFGGWKTYYKLGYQLPLTEVIEKDGIFNTLKINFIDHMYDNLVIEEATVRIILPEGAVLKNVRPPFDVERLPEQTKLTYLDVVGRTIITLKKKNLIEEHIQYVEVVYEYNQLWQLQEPLLVIGTILLSAISLFIYTKLDFSLVKRKEKTA